MKTLGSGRREVLNTVVLLAVVFVALKANKIVPDLDSKPLVQAVALATSKGIYELLIRLIYFVINSSGILLRLYWGRLFLRGYWSYQYTLDGKTYFGIWEIEQDIDSIHIIGQGLNASLTTRTIVRSLSPLIEEHGGYFVINMRNELANANANALSKTTLLVDRPKHPWSVSMAMRGVTEVFGGPSDKQKHLDVMFTRHRDARTVEDVIERLRIMHALNPPHPSQQAALPQGQP